jgi:hypothetical protein
MRTASLIAKVVVFAGLGLLAINAASATDAKCTQQTYVCTDTGPNARPRTCVTTICTDSDGNIVSTNTIVLNQGGGQSGSGNRNPAKLAGSTPAAGGMRRAD